MKDYHRILEISTDATEEEIRAQYKRLVRIYHPDRFTNPQDKTYVEQKLKEIAEAYHGLLADVRGLSSSPSSSFPLPDGASTQGSTLSPKPVVVPTLLDFGSITKGLQRSLQFQILNDGGVVNNLQLHYGNDPSWFKVTSGRRLYKSRPFPMVFAVIVDASRLQAGKSYYGWIRIEMDEAITQLSLSANVVKRNPLLFLSPRITLALSMMLLLVAFTSLRLFDSFLPSILPNSQSFQPVEVALSQPTATTADDSTEEREAAIIVIQPATITSSSTPVPMGRDPFPINSSAILSNRAIQVEKATASPTGIRGRMGVKTLTPNAPLLPPAELWAKTISSPIAIPPTATPVGLVAMPPRSAAAVSTVTPRASEEKRTTPTVSITTSGTATTELSSTATNTATPFPNTVVPNTVVLASTLSQSTSPASTSTNIHTLAITATTTLTSTLMSVPLPTANTRVPATIATTTAAATSTRTPASTATSTLTSTGTPTAISTPTLTRTATATSTYTPASTATSTLTSTGTPTAISTPTLTRTATATSTYTAASTATSTLTSTRTTTATNRATLTKTLTPTTIGTDVIVQTFTPTATLAVLTSTVTFPPTSTALSTTIPAIPTTVIGNAIVLIPNNYNVNARADISVNADVLQILISGTQWVAVGRTIDSTWLLIRLSNGQFGWVFTTTVMTDSEQVRLLPVVLPE